MTSIKELQKQVLIVVKQIYGSTAMSTDKIISAWKDEEYRMSLTESERAELPDSPVGIIELSNQQMDQATGGSLSHWLSCLPYCINTLVGPLRCFPEV